MRLQLQIMLAALLAWTLTACALWTQIAAPEIKHDPVKVACESFRAITYDRMADTLPTILQVKQHNAAYEALCPKPLPR